MIISGALLLHPGLGLALSENEQYFASDSHFRVSDSHFRASDSHFGVTLRAL